MLPPEEGPPPPPDDGPPPADYGPPPPPEINPGPPPSDGALDENPSDGQGEDGPSTPHETSHSSSSQHSEGYQSLFDGYHSLLEDDPFSPDTVPAAAPLQPVEQVIPPAAEPGDHVAFHPAPLHPEVDAPDGPAAAAHIDPFDVALPNASIEQDLRARGRAGAHDLRNRSDKERHSHRT